MSSPTAPHSPEHPSHATLTEVFSRAARETPQRQFLRTRRDSLTFGDVEAWSASIAGGLHAHGVRAGDRVVVAAPNRAEVVAVWIACLRLGAVFAPINPDVPTLHLRPLLDALGPTALVRGPGLDGVAAASGPGTAVVTLDSASWEAVESATPYDDWAAARMGDLAAVMCTSGTTGPSKAVALSHRWFTKLCETTAAHWGFSAGDRFYSPLPLYHMDGLAMTVTPAMYHATTACIGERFSVSRFWTEVREFEATVFDFLGSTLTLLWKQPETDEDSHNPARLGWGVPLPAFQADFERRFGCRLIDCYGSTDVGIPVVGRVGEAKPAGSCGRTVPGYELAILDDDGHRLPPDTVGEIAVRTHEPHVILEEYVGAPAATVEAWRGLWHHTGDTGRLDARGYLTFEGRVTDSIRRRGENVSAHELEALVLGNDAVVDVAAIGVPSELTEEDIKIVAVAREAGTLTARELAQWVADQVPRYMTVRYVELVLDLPRTETGKISKTQLRAGWATPATWDAEHQRPLAPTAERGAAPRMIEPP